MVVYHTVVHQTRQNEAVQLVAKTFSKYAALDVKRSTFPLGHLHLYITVNKDMSTVKAHFSVNPLIHKRPPIELAAMQDIPTIPVMHPAIQESLGD